MTFREKSAAVTIAAILLVYGLFGLKIWSTLPNPVGAVVALVVTTIGMIVIEIVAHVALIIHRRPEPADERDRIIGLRSVRNAYYVLGAGVWMVMLLAVVQVPPAQLAYALMGAFVLAELVRNLGELVYARMAV